MTEKTKRKVDRGLLLDVMVKIADQFYDGGLIILRVGKRWHVAFGSLDDWDVDQMPNGRSFFDAARAAYNKHGKELDEEILEEIIKPVLREREQATARNHD